MLKMNLTFEVGKFNKSEKEKIKNCISDCLKDMFIVLNSANDREIHVVRSNATSFWATMTSLNSVHHISKGNKEYLYRGKLKITNQLLMENEVEFRNVICHELLHLMPNGSGHSNSKGDWKIYANKMNNSGKGYNITPRKAASEDCMFVDTYKYIAKCNNCGGVIKQKRISKFITHMERYQCSKCGGKFTLQ